MTEDSVFMLMDLLRVGHISLDDLHPSILGLEEKIKNKKRKEAIKFYSKLISRLQFSEQQMQSGLGMLVAIMPLCHLVQRHPFNRTQTRALFSPIRPAAAHIFRNNHSSSWPASSSQLGLSMVGCAVVLSARAIKQKLK